MLCDSSNSYAEQALKLRQSAAFLRAHANRLSLELAAVHDPSDRADHLEAIGQVEDCRAHLESYAEDCDNLKIAAMAFSAVLSKAV